MARAIKTYLTAITLLACLIGCATRGPAPTASMAGPSMQPQVTAKPEMHIEATGPVEATTEIETDTIAESAAPETDTAPQADAGRDAIQNVQTEIRAVRESMQAQQSAVAGLAREIGTVNGNLEQSIAQFDLSARQLELAKERLSRENEEQARWIEILCHVLAAAGGVGFIAASLDAPKDRLGKWLLRGLGLVIVLGAILPMVL